MANLQLMKTTITRALNTTVLLAKKHSPEILVVGGVIGTVASAVMACKATTKLDEILEDTKLRVDLVHDVREHPENYENGDEFTEEDAKKELTTAYVRAGLKVAQVYAPAVILGALSITSILTGHNILKRRNLALAAAYTAVDKGFKEYRGRVIERFGEEIDKQLTYNLKPEEVEETVIDEKTGKEKKVKKTVYKGDGTSSDPYR